MHTRQVTRHSAHDLALSLLVHLVHGLDQQIDQSIGDGRFPVRQEDGVQAQSTGSGTTAHLPSAFLVDATPQRLKVGDIHVREAGARQFKAAYEL